MACALRLPDPDHMACGPNQDAGPGNGQDASVGRADALIADLRRRFAGTMPMVFDKDSTLLRRLNDFA